jgi:hypothetical protein
MAFSSDVVSARRVARACYAFAGNLAHLPSAVERRRAFAHGAPYARAVAIDWPYERFDRKEANAAGRFLPPLSTLPDGISSRRFRNAHHHRF